MNELTPDNFRVYLISSLVFLVSGLSAYFLRNNEVIKSFLTVPFVGSLCLALYKSWKDDQLQNSQQDFILGIASHMAEVAYDKHVIFCEEYISRLQKGLEELYQKGASKYSLTIGRELAEIRQKHSAWITEQIEKELTPLEDAFIEIGIKGYSLDHEPTGPQRTQIVKRIYEVFGLLLGDKSEDVEIEESKVAIGDVIEKIRNILGINALTELRLETIKIAVKRLKAKDM